VNTRETFYAARRAYRAAHNVPLTAEGAVQSCLAATSLLRAITGRWDTCKPCAPGDGRTGRTSATGSRAR
jgi:hypothetical protein